VSDAPRVRLEPLAIDRWRLTNEGAAPLRLLGSWLPHGRFRGAARTHDRVIAPGESLVIEHPVETSGRAGEIVENAFLILRFEDSRVLARLAIHFDQTARPRAEVVVLTSQPAGFSGVEE
jgi:hypothetical protein